MQEIKNQPLSIEQKDKLFGDRFRYVRQYFDDLETETIEPTVQDEYLYGLCRPERLMDLIFNFVLYDNGEKKIARYQQFFAIKKAMQRMLQIEGGRRKGGVIWHTQGGQLIEYDPKINTNGGDNGAGTGLESSTRLTVDLFLTLGVTEIQPGSAIWDENRQRFTGMTVDGRKLNIDVILENGVPSLATVLRDDGLPLATIRYKYAPTFYHGQVPVEFTRYWNNFTDDDKKVFTVRVRSLEISDEHLDTALIVPAQLLAGYSKVFYSNNIAYWVTRNGKVSKVLTMEEAKQQMESLKARAAQRRN